MKILINCPWDPWGPLQNFPWDPWAQACAYTVGGIKTSQNLQKSDFSKIALNRYFDSFLTSGSAGIEFSIKNYIVS